MEEARRIENSKTASSRSLTMKRAMCTLVLCCAAVLRFSGLDYSVPFHFHIDEQLLLTSSVDLGESPSRAIEQKYFFNYGALSRVPVAAAVAVARGFGKLNLSSPRQLRALYLFARSFSALCGVLTVVVIWVIGERFVGPGVGLSSAFLLTFSPLHLRDSHFFTPDIPMTLLIVAALGLTLRAARREDGFSAALAGAAAGFAAATKLNAAAALLPLPFVFLLIRDVRRFLVFCICLIVAFLIGSWPVFLAPGRFLESLGLLSSWAKGISIRQADLQFVNRTPWWYWLANLLRYGAGPVFLSLGLVGGLVLLLKREKRLPSLLILSVGLCYFIIMGASFQKFMRFSLPLHPLLALSGGVFIVLRARRRVIHRGVLSVLLVVHACYGIAYAGVFWRQDPRIVAGKELSAVLPANTAILLETTHSNPPLIEADRRAGLYTSYLPQLGRCTVERLGEFNLLYIDPYVYLYEKAKTPRERWDCLVHALDRVDVVIIGPRYRDQYLRLSEQFPVMAKFYGGLDSGELGFSLVSIYENPARIGGFVIPDQRSELTFRLFDRPYLRVYARGGSSAEERLCEIE